MHVSFYGAVREVTGSMHLITTEQDRILLDCGMFQGRRKETKEKNTVMPFDPRILTNVVLSHAHIDHSGRLPLLTRNDFAGRIISTRATAAACEYLLPDSAHIQESDAQYLNYKVVRSALQKMEGSAKKGKTRIKSLKKNKHKLDVDRINELIDRFDLEGVSPLYSAEDAQEALLSWLKIRNAFKENLFYSQHRNSLSYEAARCIFIKYLEKAGLSYSGYTLHCLRHTFATDLLNARMPLECLRVLLGHTSLEVTRIYARLTDKTREQEYFMAMERILKGETHADDPCDY